MNELLKIESIEYGAIAEVVVAVSTKSHEVVLTRTMAAETASWEPPADVDYFVGIDDCSCVADAAAYWLM
jgi:hypothetical protein